jgi:hypothetical protein
LASPKTDSKEQYRIPIYFPPLRMFLCVCFYLHNWNRVSYNRLSADKIFLGYWPCQLVKNHRSFRDHLCPHNQGLVDLKRL